MSNSGSFIVTDSTFTYSGVISGSGNFQVQGSSKLTLSGLNTYLGSTNLGSGAMISLSGSIGNSSTYSGVFDNSGTLQLTSTGKVYVTEFINESSGTISGCGSITTSGTFYNYGTITSGCSPSPLTINTGTFITESGSIISPFIDPSGAAPLIILGNVFIENGVTLELNPQPGCYNDISSFPVIEANNITGTFTTVEINSILFTPELSYSGSSVVFSLQRNPLTEFATEPNESAVAESLECLFTSNPTSPSRCVILPRLFFLSSTQIGELLDEMQPSLFKGITISQENNAIRIQQALDVRLQDVLNTSACTNFDENPKGPRQKKFHLWSDGFGDFLQQKTIEYVGNSEIGYQTKTGGAVLGFDTGISYFRAGVLTGYTGSDIKWVNDAGKGTIDTVYGGVYLSANSKYVYGNLSVTGGFSHFKGHRNIHFGEETISARHNNGGAQLSSHLDTGLNFAFGRYTLRPFDSFQYLSQTENGYTEKGAGALDLHVKHATAILIRNELGLRMSGCFSTERGKWTISPKFSWVREVRVKGSEYQANFIEEECSFLVTGYFPDRSLFSPGLQIGGAFYDDLFSLGLYFDGQYGRKFRNQNYGGQIKFAF